MRLFPLSDRLTICVYYDCYNGICDCVSLVVVKIGQVDNMYIGDYWTLDWYDMTKMSFGTAGRAVNWEIEIDSYRDE